MPAMEAGRFLDLTIFPGVGYALAWGLTELCCSECGYQFRPQPWWAFQMTSANYGPIRNNVLFLLGMSSFFIWRIGYISEDHEAVKEPLLLYGAMLVFFWMHYPLLRGFCDPKWALVDITLGVMMSYYVNYHFFRISPLAGALMVSFSLIQTHMWIWTFWCYQQKHPVESPRGGVLTFESWLIHSKAINTARNLVNAMTKLFKA